MIDHGSKFPIHSCQLEYTAAGTALPSQSINLCRQVVYSTLRAADLISQSNQLVDLCDYLTGQEVLMSFNATR